MFKLTSKVIFVTFSIFYLVSIPNCISKADITEDCDRYLLNARIFFHHGAYTQALEEYKKLESLKPNSKTAILNQALIYKDLRQYNKAIKRYKKLLEIAPNRIIYKNIGEVYMLNAMPLEAIKAFRTAISLGQEDEILFFWLGMCFEDIKDTKNAIWAYGQAIKLSKSFALAHFNLGNIYQKDRLWDRAGKEFEITKEQDPSIKKVYPALMRIYFKLSKYDQALKYSRKVLAVEPDNIDAPKYIAKIDKHAGKKFKKEISRRKKVRIEESYAKMVPLKKRTKSEPPIVRVHISDAKKFRFKCAEDFRIVKTADVNEIIFEGRKDRLYSIVNSQKAITLFDNDRKVKDIAENILIEHNDEKATILIFDIEAGKGKYWASKTDRIYRGKINIRKSEDFLRIINIVDMEEYLYGVLPSEMPSDWPKEALKAQAVAARSEAYKKLTRHKKDGYDFCSDVHCQVYSGAKVETKESKEAIDSTAGIICMYEGNPIDAVYSNSCGGHTQGNIFSKRQAIAYLHEKQDAINPTGFYFPLSALELEDWLWSTRISVFCNNEKFSRKSNFRWQRMYTREQLENLIRKKMDIGKLKSIEIKERHPSAHIHKIEIIGTRGKFAVEKELNIRRLLGNLRSSMFNIDVKLNKKGQPVTFLFYGGGWGHGVGMCQVGAATMAEQGKTFDDILKFYYTGISIEQVY